MAVSREEIVNAIGNLSVLEVVELISDLEKKFGVTAAAPVKVVRELTGLGLKEAKDLVEGVPALVKDAVAKADVDAMKKKLEDAGAKVVVK
jgi:large subunit ribosomal protein L7/L12